MHLPGSMVANKDNHFEEYARNFARDDDLKHGIAPKALFKGFTQLAVECWDKGEAVHVCAQDPPPAPNAPKDFAWLRQKLAGWGELI